MQTFVRETNELVHIKVNGEEIITTPTHPFWVPQKGWTDAIQLRAGDRLQLLNGEYVIIEQVQHELLESPVIVYNFEVEGFHTYFVGEQSILVHNICLDDSESLSKGIPNSTSIRYDTKGKIYSATTYGANGRIVARIDFQGKPHYVKGYGKIIPHVHTFSHYGDYINKGPVLALFDYIEKLRG